jgi:hypothetical protein
MTRKPAAVQLMVFIAGLAAATAAGVLGYRVVGLYGDGAFAAGYHRATDPQTGQSVLVHEVDSSKGRIRRVIDSSLQVREVRIDFDGDSVMETAAMMANGQPTRTAVDQTKNGTADTWGYWSGGRLTRAELDLDENGTIERWEHYGADNGLEKVGTSSKGDGVEDSWSYPDSMGLILKEEFDTDRDGRVDKRHLYSSPPASPSTRVISVVEIGIDASGTPERRLHYRFDGSFDRVERVSRPHPR